MRYIFFTVMLCAWATPVFAQEIHQDLKEIIEAEVTAIVEEGERQIVGTETTVSFQDIEAKLLSGSREGETIIFQNELVPLAKGDVVYLNYVETIDGFEYFIFKDYKRQSGLVWLALIFMGVLVLFAGKQGVRALFSLGLSIGAILFILIPALLAGYNPALSSLVIAGIVLACVLFLTHGFNSRTTIAFVGTFSAVLVTCFIAWLWVDLLHLSGLSSDVSIYLNLSTQGALDFSGLLLGSIIIGVLGVLDDVSITQASVVQELKYANENLSVRELYGRAIRVGRDHVGSLVNTLALAYIGVSLPLVLLFARADAEVFMTLNQEVVAAELVRIIVGSIGLVLAVPLTTLAAAWYYGPREVDKDDIASCGHSHAH